MTSKALVLATAIDGDAVTEALMQGRRTLGETTAVSLTLYEPEKISYELMEDIGRLLGHVNRKTQWMIGDWLVLVEDVFPDRYEQAALVTRLSEHTLENRASVCRKIPASERRPGVPFSVHAELTRLPPAERKKWLDRAEAGDWTREVLREHLKPRQLPPAGENCPTCGRPL